MGDVFKGVIAWVWGKKRPLGAGARNKAKDLWSRGTPVCAFVPQWAAMKSHVWGLGKSKYGDRDATLAIYLKKKNLKLEDILNVRC